MASLGFVALRTILGLGRTGGLTLIAALALPCPLQALFGWGHEGHEVIALIAEHYMSPVARTRARDLLDGASIDSVASWADDYRHNYPGTGPSRYIDIPLADSRIDKAPECPSGDCVVAQTERSQGLERRKGG